MRSYSRLQSLVATPTIWTEMQECLVAELDRMVMPIHKDLHFSREAIIYIFSNFRIYYANFNGISIGI